MNTQTPDLTSYRSVHVALRSGAHLLATAVADLDTDDRRRVRALARYWRGYSNEVVIHHTTEDDVFFPALAERVPVAAGHMDRAATDHHELDELMAAASAAIDAIEAGRDVSDHDATRAAPATFRALAAHMDEHLGFEDDDVLPLFARHFSSDEYEALEQQAYRQLGIGKQAAFTVPFVLWFATPEIRAHLLGAAPVPFRVLYRLTRRRHAGLVRAAFGDAAPAVGGRAFGDKAVS